MFTDELAAFAAITELPRSRKGLIIYSEGAQYWPHFRGILRDLLFVQRCPFVYVSSDSDDPGLQIHHPLVRTFNVGSRGFRKNFLEEIEGDIMVLTMPDLANLSLGRSPGCRHYAYLFHSSVSTHMVYRDGAFDHYDSIFCAGPHHEAEIMRREEMHGLPAKRLFKHGYSRLDELIADEATRKIKSGSAREQAKTQVLLAPSWGPSGILETIGIDVIEAILDAGFRVVVRPHPQTLRLARARIDDIRERFSSHGDFELETDMSLNNSFFDSDVAISDWSGAALEYAFARLRPVVFIDTPRKANNPNWSELGIEPLEASIRTEIGMVIPSEDLTGLIAAITTARDRADEFRERILELRCKWIYNPGDSDHVAAQELARMVFDAALGDEGSPDDLKTRCAAFARATIGDMDHASTLGSVRYLLDTLIVGEAPISSADLGNLTALCRHIDVRKQLHEQYDPTFAKPAPQSGVAQSTLFPALVYALTVAAEQVGKDDAGLALKLLNSAGNVIGMYADTVDEGGTTALESLVARACDRVIEHAA